MNGLYKFKKVEELIKGAIDMHVHVSPDAVPRSLDAIELAIEGRKLGMSGFLLKDHLTITADRAYLVEKAVPGIRVFGTLVLNHAVGGLNPSAVLAALALNVKQIFMPTFSAYHDIGHRQNNINSLNRLLTPKNLSGIRILTRGGTLLPEVNDILEIIKDSNLILGTGHLSPEESLALIERARFIGLSKIVVTHASNPIIRMSINQQKKAAELGAFIEHSYLACLRGIQVKDIARDIVVVGPKQCILSTDLGQQGNPTPIEGLICFITELLKLGINKKDIFWMIKDNPRILLGLG